MTQWIIAAAAAVIAWFVIFRSGKKDIKQREKEVRNEVHNLDDAGLANLANELIRKGSGKR